MAGNILAEFMTPDQNPAPVPDAETLISCKNLLEAAHDIDTAGENFKKIRPLLARNRGALPVLSAAADLLERKRFNTGMLETWSALHEAFPHDIHFLRMRLRWLRRGKFIEEGFSIIKQSLPHLASDPSQAEAALLAYRELRAFDEIDDMMEGVLPRHPEDAKIRVLYAKNLMEQKRYVAASKIVSQIREPERLGSASRRIITEIIERAKFQTENLGDDVVGLLGRLVSRYSCRSLRPTSPLRLGGVVFYTGQLGAGGAERQLTRIAAKLETVRKEKGELDGVTLSAPIRVAVRHANKETGADFFLPVLKNAGVKTFLAVEAPKPEISDLGLNDAEFEQLLTYLPADILDNTLRLVPYLKKHEIEVAYLWQDGGILTSALAALIAGVPRIILSFRGLPPNLRPDLYRPQLEGLYRNLAKVPGVIFSSNSLAAARAYSGWLDIPLERFEVVYNALEPASSEGDTQDRKKWGEIKARSGACLSTVVGIFRFDPNKRPMLWVEAAAAFLEKHPNTRFIIAGQGAEFARCSQKIRELGLEKRIFLIGRSNNVGYWLERADVLLHLARFEGLPNAVIEAQIAGLPVIATPAGGTAEALQHGETGFILSSSESPDIGEITSYLEEVLFTDGLAARMGISARKFASDHFTLERALTENLRLFVAPHPLKRTP